jgi:hypothetical protein
MMGMNVSQISAPLSAPVPASLESKRAALQTMILKKSLENQQQAADAMTREADGKGQNLDIRV